MSAIAKGIFEDLRQRRLLPVAGLLLVVLVALPTFMLKKSSAPAVVPPVATGAAAPASAAGLPSPEQVLSADKPLVSLAVLKDPSTLDTYRRRNPFKPLQGLVATAGSGATGATPTPTPDASEAQTVAQSGGGSAGGGGSAPSGGGGGGSTPTTPTPTPTPTTTTPQDTDANETKPEKLTYALDLTFRSPRGGRTYRSVAKLRMLPSQAQPLFVYLGVDTTGTKAVFLVDSSLTFAGGEGSCSPDRNACATVSLQPGEIATFTNAASETYQLEIDQIRTVSAKSAAASARKADRNARASSVATAADGTPRPKARRFMPPVITDLFTGSTR